MILYVLACHVALYVNAPHVHPAIVTLVCAVVPFAPVHHLNVYHVFVGACNVIGNCVILYVAGLFALFVHQFILYVILFVFSVAVGAYVWSAVIVLYVCGLLELLHVLAHV